MASKKMPMSKTAAPKISGANPGAGQMRPPTVRPIVQRGVPKASSGKLKRV
jgi:hypothetical protein